MPAMSSFIDYQSTGTNTPLTCVLDKISKILERRLIETRNKVDKLNDVYVAERSNRFVQEDVHDLEGSGHDYLFNKVLESRQLALERRNSDLERRLIVNETVNKHFEDVIHEFERDLLKILADAKSTEVERVAYCLKFKSENSELKRKIDEEERYSLGLVQEKEKIEGTAIELQEKVNSLNDKIKEMDEKLTAVEIENKKLTMDSASMINRLKSDADEFKKLQDTLEETKDNNQALLEKIKALENHLEVEKRRVKAISAEYEDRIDKEKELLKEELSIKHENLLLEQRNGHNLLAQRMKESFEKQMKLAAEYNDECVAKLKKYQQRYSDLEKNFEKRVLQEVTKKCQELEKRYMKIASVPITVGKVTPEKEVDTDIENIPRRLLREWQQSDADSRSSVSSLGSRSNYSRDKR
ncbi:unnamed protein product [Bursaphelenchus xylophilus]|uniref:(pine wood nematode) hypothetical protein n=1 Tax=Bursaphelenchus xylophilus TaxID=6326 RepID=A0A1I7SBK4_BURXY|nr:unnamed protein product [Bursaphelenchus xylophilus]CAG9114416.1 unnamed protein product [Bursaphelenchus xylophilus]